MNRSELLPLLWKNDIPLEMRMMLCKLADLGVEFEEGVYLVDDWASGAYHAMDDFGWAGNIERIYVNGELRGGIEEGDLVAINDEGLAVLYDVEEVNADDVDWVRHEIGPDGIIRQIPLRGIT